MTKHDEVEKLSAEIHNCYCRAYERRFGKPYWTGGDYSKLEEVTKDYDREMARWHMKEIADLKRSLEEAENALSFAEGVTKAHLHKLHRSEERVKDLEEALLRVRTEGGMEAEIAKCFELVVKSEQSRARLRGALEDIRDMPECDQDDTLRLRDRAKSALKEEEEEKG